MAILLSFGLGVGEAFELPKGWIAPVDSTFLGAWRKPSPSRYLAASTDMNCDGLPDSAMILQPALGRGIGLFLFLQDSNGNYKAKLLFDSRKQGADLKGRTELEKAKVQWRYRTFYGIRAVERGLYPTACGQGYRICGKGEKRRIEVECGGIDFYSSDQGGNIHFYWDRKRNRYLSAVMSD